MANAKAIAESMGIALQDILVLLNKGRTDCVRSIFNRVLKKAVSIYVSMRKVKRQNSKEPIWFNTGTTQDVQKQIKAYNKFTQSGNPHLLNEYKLLRRANRGLFRRMEINYYNKILYEPQSNGHSKPFYSFLNVKREDV